MVLTSIELERFKRFRQLIVTFKPGLNVIRGPNEAGKSTLREAILAAFFANPTSSSEMVKTWNMWGQVEPCSIKLTYLSAEGQVCQVRKDFSARKIFWIGEDENLKMPKAIHNQLMKEIGIPSPELFTLSCALDVRSLSQFENQANRRQIGKILSGMMTGAGQSEDAGGVIKILQDALRELVKGQQSAAKNPGPLKSAHAQLVQLQAEKKMIQQSIQEQQRQKDELVSLEKSLDANGKRLAAIRRVVEANTQLIEARRRWDNLSEQDAQFDALNRSIQAREAERAELQQKPLEPAIRYSAAEIRDLQALLERKNQLGEKIAENEPSNATWLLAVATALLSGVGIGLLFIAAVAGGIVLVLGIILGSYTYREILRWRRHATLGLARETERQQQLADVQARLTGLLARADGMSAEMIISQWPDAQRVQARLDALHRQLHETPLDKAAWEGIRRQLRLANDVLQETGLCSLQLEPAALAEHQRELKHLEEEMNNLRLKQARFRALLDHSQGDTDRLSELDEKSAEVRGRIDYLEKREKIIGRALIWLDQARRDTLSPARQVMESRAADLFRQFSAGRYSRIMIDDEDLSSKIYVSQTGQWEEPASFSQGTFDQFFLALRIALSEILSGGLKPPLILDEPFAAFDAERRRSAVQSLKILSRERQVLLFTCRDEYDSDADQVITLGAPTEDSRRNAL